MNGFLYIVISRGTHLYLPVKIWDEPNISNEIINVNISLWRANMVPKLSMECISSQILDDTMINFHWQGTHQIILMKRENISNLVCILVSTFALTRENTYVNITKFLLALSCLPLESQGFFLKNILFPTPYHKKFQTHRTVERILQWTSGATSPRFYN